MPTWMPDDLPFALLVLARIGGMVFAAPLLSERTVPLWVKLGLSAALAVMFLPLVGRPSELPSDAVAFGGAAIGEASVGILIGFAASFLFFAAKGAGRMIEQQIGLSLDPDMISAPPEEESSWVGFSGLLVAVVFLSINGHHHLLSATLGSFDSIPVMGRVQADATSTVLIGHLGGSLFSTALHLAGPVIVTMLLVSLAAGFIARAVPEFDCYSSLLGARAVVGLVAVSVGVGIAMSGFSSAWLSNSPDRFLNLLGGRP